MDSSEFEALLARYTEGKTTPAEDELVEKWLDGLRIEKNTEWQQSSQREKTAFIDGLFLDIQAAVKDKAAEKGDDGVKQKKGPGTRLTGWLFGAAASICVSCGIWLMLERDGKAEPNHEKWQLLVAGPGHRKQVQLADGTTIWLQGGSELSYPAKFSDGQRLVKLDGEAYFDVSPDSKKPFIVKAGDLETEVLGTSFNIDAFSELDKKVVSLIEGKVAVRIRDSAGIQQGKDIVLTPHEAAIFQQPKRELTKSELPVFGSPEDFKSGNLQFDETPVDEVLFRLGIAYGVEIDCNFDQAKQQKITGNFILSEPVDDVFQSLARSIGAQYRRSGKAITIVFE